MRDSPFGSPAVDIDQRRRGLGCTDGVAQPCTLEGAQCNRLELQSFREVLAGRA